MKNLNGKRALITGAASGIGREIALTLAREGVDVYLVDIDENGLSKVVQQAQEYGVTARGRFCDLSDTTQTTTCLNGLLSESGGLDILVNNAGIACYGPTDEMTEQQWNQLLNVNLLAPIEITRQLLPILLEQNESHILNVGSLASLVAGSKLTAYNVSKFGLLGLSESLLAEYGRGSLGVTALCPGFVRTQIFQNSPRIGSSRQVRTPPTWLTTTPEKVAAIAVRAIRKNQPLVVVTPLARILWFCKRLAPSLFLKLMSRRPKKRTTKTSHNSHSLPEMITEIGRQRAA
ncbi:SDR family oxidoreductase [Gimesia sp.]|uniref:SDR family NAD(P)-dependent oxidoreductase n=1 Tax=Gimesia sp. TaxID=2024833 RepID=UPI0032EB18C1